MASGRPILACGPSYAACNQFIKTWNCGLVCETNRVSEVKTRLLEIIKNNSDLYSFSSQAFTVVKNNFEVGIVRKNLYDFIHSISSQR
jgi:hypothetical protein